MPSKAVNTKTCIRQGSSPTYIPSVGELKHDDFRTILQIPCKALQSLGWARRQYIAFTLCGECSVCAKMARMASLTRYSIGNRAVPGRSSLFCDREWSYRKFRYVQVMAYQVGEAIARLRTAQPYASRTMRTHIEASQPPGALCRKTSAICADRDSDDN